MLMISGLHTATGQSYVTYGLYGEYEEDPKSYFLRVQFNFIDADAPNEDAAWWEVGGYDLADEAQKGLDNLNQAFNPHGIFFLADEPTPDCATPATYRSYFDLQNQNPQGLSVLELIRGSLQTEDEVERALNIYINSGQGEPLGFAPQLPGNHVTVKGLEAGELATSGTITVHEVGHALGLLHTFAGDVLGECNEGDIPEPVGFCSSEEDLCYCCGDYVCDTDYDLNEDFELDPTDCSGGESIPASVRRNYMNYISPDECRNAFTEQQGLRMKMYLRELKDYYSDDVLEKIQLQEAAYPGTAPSGVTGNLTVESEVLEILSPLQMLPGATITVKTGAALHIKSTLTSACDEMWQGIKVESGGIVKVFGQGVIEHAECGIDVVGNSSEVSILGGTLLNNSIGLRVAADDAIETSNQVFFANFELNDQYKGASDERPYFMVLRGNRGTRIRYTTFADERTADCSAPNGDCPKRAIGIDAREEFFFGDMPFFQLLWARIPQLVALTPYQSGTYSSLSALFSALSPYVSEGGGLSNMPKPLVEALYNFTTHCNEAGFLAVELLRRNGVEAAVQCNSPSPAMAQQNSGGPQAKELHHRQDRRSAVFFPNPTQGTLQVVLSEGTDRASLILYNLQGQPAFQAVLTGQRTTLQLPVPAGIYWARLQIAGQQPVHHKIIVSR